MRNYDISEVEWGPRGKVGSQNGEEKNEEREGMGTERNVIILLSEGDTSERETLGRKRKAKKTEREESEKIKAKLGNKK